jgi:branched-chain amino acid transport system permease protein
MKYLLKLDPLFHQIGRFYTQKPYRGFISLGGLLLLIPLLHFFNVVSSGSLGIYAYIIMMTVVALGLNLLLGFSGLISLGTAGFVGAGALGLGVFLNLGLPFELAALATLIISTSIGAMIGLFSLKVEGIYLAIATLFVGEILRQIYTTVPIFGGQSITIGRITFLGLFELSTYNQSDRRWLFVIITIILIFMMILMYHIVHSKTGRAFLAMSRSSSAAQAMGVSLLKYRLLAFSLATFFATMGGIMYGLYYQFTTTTEWTLNLSLLIIAMVVVGGYKSIYGTLLGVYIIHGIPNFFLKNIFGDVSFIFSGLLIILVILFYQNGTAYLFTDLRLRYLKAKFKERSHE